MVVGVYSVGVGVCVVCGGGSVSGAVIMWRHRASGSECIGARGALSMCVWCACRVLGCACGAVCAGGECAC
jgi:hypothetical protein